MNEQMEVNGGEVGVAAGLGEQAGRILLVVPANTRYIAMDPQQAVAVAKDMIDKAVKAGAEVQIIVPKKPLSAVKRSALVNRVSLVMRNLLEKKREPGYVAEQLVDIVLKDGT